MQQAVFDRGTEVGALARSLFPGGVNASPNLPLDWEQAIQFTAQLIAMEAPVIYEAGFSAGGVHCFMDILVKEPEGWHAFEVKSSSNLSNIYFIDAAFQYYVLQESGVPLTGIDIITLDSSYVRQGALDIHRLFKYHPVTTQALRLQPLIRQKTTELRAMLETREMPCTDIGPHCTDPYTCDFTGHCWQHIPPHSVFEVSGLTGQKKWELYRMGIVRMTDIPAAYPLNRAQKMQVQGVSGRTGRWNTTEVSKFLDSLEFPVYFLDFESFQAAVPLYDQTRPYQQVPFQYSLHRLDRWGAAPAHMEYLADAGPDPRPELAEQLIRDAGDRGTILVYNQAFEKGVLNDLIRDFPSYAGPVRLLLGRIRDLMDSFRKKHIYLPEMRGSHSVKHVLPAMVPGYGYDQLAIADGGMASLSFRKLFSPPDNETKEEIRKNLLDYCGMDTCGMVLILEKMRAGKGE